MQYNIARDILVLRNYPLLIWNPSLTRAPLYFLATLIWHLPQGYLWKYQSKSWVGYVRSSLSRTHFFTLLIMVPCCQRRHPAKPRLGNLATVSSLLQAGEELLTRDTSSVNLALWGGSKGKTYWLYLFFGLEMKKQINYFDFKFNYLLYIYFIWRTDCPNHWQYYK